MTSNSYWLVVHSVVKTSQNTTVLLGDFVGLLQWRVGLLKWRVVRMRRACGLLKWRTVQKENLKTPVAQAHRDLHCTEWIYRVTQRVVAKQISKAITGLLCSYIQNNHTVNAQLMHEEYTCDELVLCKTLLVILHIRAPIRCDSINQQPLRAPFIHELYFLSSGPDAICFPANEDCHPPIFQPIIWRVF